MTGLVAEFLPALRDPARAVPPGLTDGAGQPAGRRFNVYRNNVTVSLIEALETGFPALNRLIGNANFRTLARGFVAAHPPSSPLMMQYGDALPAYLAKVPALAHIPYLADVGRLELALRDSYHAADHRAMTGPELAAIPSDQLETTRLVLAPSLRLLRSAWPVVEIWAYTMRPGQPKPAGGAQDVAVLRAQFDPEPVALPEGGHAFLTALQTGEALGDAVAAATDAAPDFDPGGMLALLLAHDALSHPEEPRT